VDAPIAVIDPSTIAGEGRAENVVAALATQVSPDRA
jgi:hypothetical protein